MVVTRSSGREKGDCPDGTEDDNHDSMDEDSPDPIVPPAPHPPRQKRLHDVKILDCRPMHTARLVGGETKYSAQARFG